MNFDSTLRSTITNMIRRNPNFFRITPTLLVHTPIEHCTKYIVFKTAKSSGYFIVEWWINFLFEPKAARRRQLGRIYGSLGRSERYKPRGQTGLFELSDPSMKDDFADQIENEILPLFSRLDTLEKMATFTSNYSGLFHGSFEAWSALIKTALGDIPTAQKIWTSRNTDTIEWAVPGMYTNHPDYEQWCRLGQAIMAGDRFALTELLHEWEQVEVRGSKFERHWTSTPFPIESLT